MAENEGVDKRKAHRARHAGVKADKKSSKNKVINNAEQLTARQRNPKAFAINSAQRAERNFRRKEDLTAKKQHIPLPDRDIDEPPPMLIAVVGPPKVGKTTLIHDLIKSFTRTNVTDVRGPITIVTSKKRRITLLECNNDINSMIDVAKCADLVLLMCDASYGFEMEIFEFLNICQVHGMPKIMGVLTHLDMIRNPKQLQKRKKELKHRFWTEVYEGSKLFYLSGLLHGEYLRNEVKNLGRFISVMKMRPLQWRGAHSYILVDRLEDMTSTEVVRRNPKCDRNILLYGYVRGVPLKREHMVHIAGFGDARIEELDTIQDPCPLPSRAKKRSLLEKERLLYAPMSGVGGIVYDKDAVYIELQGSHSHHKQQSATTAEEQHMVSKLIEKKQMVDLQIAEQEFRLFSDGAAIISKDYSEQGVELEAHTAKKVAEDGFGLDEDGGKRVKENDQTAELIPFDSHDDESSDDESSNDKCSDDESSNDKCSDDESSDTEEENEQSSSPDEGYDNTDAFESGSGSSAEEECNDENTLLENNMSWKENLMQKARDAFLQRHSESHNLMRLVYGVYTQSEQKKTTNQPEDAAEEQDEPDHLGGLFKVVNRQETDKNMLNKPEYCYFGDATGSARDWVSPTNKKLISNCFVTGKWKASEDAEHLLRLDDMSDADSEMYGDFEDLETGAKHVGKDVAKEAKAETEEKVSETNLMAKKLQLKAKFDADYDGSAKNGEEDDGRITGDHQYYESLKAEAQRQSELNKNEFTDLDPELRLQIEGYRPGLYVRLGFKKIPAEFIEHFDANYPVLVGGLNMVEENIGYVNCKVKKHRWYKKILKTGDPLIISMGWRRFQTVAMFAKVEDNFRHRYLKYTPNHVTCGMTFWGPITPQNSGFLGLQCVRHDLDNIKRIGFRIAVTGCVTELDKSAQIMKKLKLVGHPFKIYKKSAFVKDMFNTQLEVTKFEGAKIRTVSGIRGQIKKAHHTPEGSFRATFEDKILLSDIVFCRTWFRVNVPRFYAPLTTLLLPPSQKTQWQGLKTLGQLKRERQQHNAIQLDSLYTEVKREPKVFKPLKIPKMLQRALPYRYKPKEASLNPATEPERVVPIQSPYDQKVGKMMKMLETNYREKRNRTKRDTKQRMKQFRTDKRHMALQKLQREKLLRKKVSRAVSKMAGKKST